MKKSILKIVHDSAKGLHEAGLIDKSTTHQFDIECLSPVNKLSPAQIKKIRTKEKVCQPVFAAYLNVCRPTIKKWQTGEKHPMALR